MFETNLIDDYALLDPEIEDDDKIKPYEYLENLTSNELSDMVIDIKKFNEIYKNDKSEKFEYFKVLIIYIYLGIWESCRNFDI